MNFRNISVQLTKYTIDRLYVTELLLRYIPEHSSKGVLKTKRDCDICIGVNTVSHSLLLEKCFFFSLMFRIPAI